MDLMLKVMMGDDEAKEKLHCLTCVAKSLAEQCAAEKMDIATLCGLTSIMMDQYQSITKISNEEIYNAWDIVRNLRDSVNAVCGDPLDQD